MFNTAFLSLRRWFQFNSRIVRTHFASVMILNNWEMIAETRSYIFRWRTLSLSSMSSLPKFSVYETTTTSQIRRMTGWMRKNDRAAHFFALFSDFGPPNNDVQVPNLRFARQRNQDVKIVCSNQVKGHFNYPLQKWPTWNNHKTLKLLRSNILRATLSMQQQLYHDTEKFNKSKHLCTHLGESKDEWISKIDMKLKRNEIKDTSRNPVAASRLPIK